MNHMWMFRDSQLSLRTLWSAVIKSPKLSARGTASPLRLLHGALVILVRLQISQFRSLGKWVWTLCLPNSSRLISIGSKEASWDELAWESPCNGISSSTKFSLNSCSHSGISEHNDSLCSFLDSFQFGFGVLLCANSPGGFEGSQTFQKKITSLSLHSLFFFPFISSPLFSSLVLSSLLFSLSFSPSLSLSLSLSLCLCLSLSPCGVVVLCLCVCVFVCIAARWKRVKNPCVWTEKPSVCAFKTSPCIPAPRAHVFQHVRVVPVYAVTFWIYTRKGFLYVHTVRQGVIVSSAYQNLPTYGYHVIQQITKEKWIFTIFSLRIGREQHVADSSKHSLCLIKLFSFSDILVQV